MNDKYKNNSYIGVVVNATDPTFSGRCQVKVFGVFDSIPDEHLPWAYPITSTIFGTTGGGSISIPKIGMFVRVVFNGGDIYAPEYYAIQNLDDELIEHIKDDYPGTHVLMYDPKQELSIIYQVGSGIRIFFKDSLIQIAPDSMITLQTPNIDSTIQMDGDVISITAKNNINITAARKIEAIADEIVVNGSQTTKIGPGPYEYAARGETLLALLSTMASALDAKLPATPGVNTGLVEAAKSAILSTNVQIGNS